MPASLFRESDHSTNAAGTLEDQRALQLALELSMLGLSVDSAADALSGNFDPDSRGKKSQNTTECVPVPSSEHVAEIVGRQGCKIKALRAKTNTYIKTPVRGEEPVFVVTGRKEDVAAAKREILSAAEHFSQIRAQRKNNLAAGGGAIGTLTGPGPNAALPGQTTIQVRVPYRVVGLVVGPKGATIKRIQQQTNTYIITPSRDKEPIFEVTGMPEMVETAKKEIEAHIAMRTGGVVDGSNMNPDDSSLLDSNDPFSRSSPIGSDSLFQQTRSALSSLYKNTDSFNPFSTSATRETSPRDIFAFGSKFADLYSSFATSSNNNNLNSSTATGAFQNLYESDEGLGDSPTFDALISSAVVSSGSVWPEFGSNQRTFGPTSERRNSSELTSSSSSTSSSSANGCPVESEVDGLGLVRRLSATDQLSSGFTSNGTVLGAFSSAVSGSTTTSSSPTESLGSLGSLNGGTRPSGKTSLKRDCIVCFDGEINAALIPCGHNLFCMECAHRVCGKEEPSCPVCHQSASQAIRIIS